MMGTPISSLNASVSMPELETEDTDIVKNHTKSEPSGRKVTFKDLPLEMETPPQEAPAQKAQQASKADMINDMCEMAPEALIDEVIREKERGDLVEAKRLNRLPKAQKEADKEMCREFKTKSNSNDEESNADEKNGGASSSSSLVPDAYEKIINTFNRNEKPVGSFHDIVGYGSIKTILSASFLAPPKLPGYFKDKKPLASVLLIGPPGCGKQLFARSLAAERGARLLSLYAIRLFQSDFLKMNRLVSQLFAYAKTNLPVVIYLEDVDAILPNEFMQLATLLAENKNAIEKEKPAEFILIAGTRSPPGFKSTVLFDKVLKIEPLTCPERVEIIILFLRGVFADLSTSEIIALALQTKYFTPGEFHALIREVKLLQVHSLYSTRHFKRALIANNMPSNGPSLFWTPCKESDHGAVRMKYSDIPHKDEMLLPRLNMELFKKCLSTFELERVGALDDTSDEVVDVAGTTTDHIASPAVANGDLGEQEGSEPARPWHHFITDCLWRN